MNGNGERGDNQRRLGRIEEAQQMRAEAGEVARPGANGEASGSRSPEECRQAWAIARPWREDPRARRFLEKARGFDLAAIPDDVARVIPDWRISSDGKPVHSLVYAMRSVETGEVVGFQMRRFDRRGDLLTIPAKSVGSGRKTGAVVMVGGPLDAARVILVDGQEDALAVWQAIGGEVSGAAVWATTMVAFGGERWPVVAGRQYIFLCDAGSEQEKGQASAARMAEAGHSVLVAPPPDGVFPADFPIAGKAGKPFKDANDALLAGCDRAIIDALERAVPALGGQAGGFEGGGAVPVHPNGENRANEALRRMFKNYYVRERVGPFGRVSRDIVITIKKREKGASGAKAEPVANGHDPDNAGGDRGENLTLFLCEYFEIEALLLDEFGEAARLILVYRDKRHVIPLEKLICEPARVLSARAIGFDADQSPALKTFFQLMKNRVRKRLDLGRAGFVEGGGFVLVDGRYIGPTRPDTPTYEPPHDWRRVRPAGTLAGWQEKVTRPAMLSPHVVLSLGLGFASPLVRLLGLRNAGLLWVGESSSGKSTFLKVTASLIGPPDVFAPPAKSSEPAFYNTANLLSDHPLIYDEMEDGGSDNALKILSYMSYGHSNGASPGRVDRETMDNRRVKRWCSVLQVSSEVDPAAMAQRQGMELRGGMEGRFPALKVRRRRSTDYGAVGLDVLDGIDDLHDAIVDGLREEYGTAWPRYIERLLLIPPENLRSRFRKLSADFLARVGFDPLADTGNIRRVAGLFALATLGLEVAFEAGVLPKDLARASCANGMPVLTVPFHFLELWIDQRDGKEAREVGQVVEMLRAWISDNAIYFGQVDCNGNVRNESRSHLAFWHGSFFGDDDDLRTLENDPESRVLWMAEATLLRVVFGKSGMPRGLIIQILRAKGVIDGEAEKNGAKQRWRPTVRPSQSLQRATGLKRMLRLDVSKL